MALIVRLRLEAGWRLIPRLVSRLIPRLSRGSSSGGALPILGTQLTVPLRLLVGELAVPFRL